MLRSVLCCLEASEATSTKHPSSQATERTLLLAGADSDAYLSEKPPTYRRPKVDVANDIIEVLYSGTAACNTSSLEKIVHEAGWWDKAIAQAVLAALEHAISAGKRMSSPMHRAYDRAVEEARKIKEFGVEHPILAGAFLTVVALGVLYFMWPEILLALGFGEDGVVLGSFAARWQSLYPNVPVSSVFAFLQRLGMTVKP